MALPRGFRMQVSWSNLLILILVIGITGGSALNQIYCSSQNTGSGPPEATSLYQSNGACFDYCKANYAFAIVQYQYCWCSDYSPAETTTTDSCNDKCPGFPDENCGSLSNGLFGYIALSKEPIGTLGIANSLSPSSPASVAVSSEQAVSSQDSGRSFSSPSSLIQVPTIPPTATAPLLPSIPFLRYFSSFSIFTSTADTSPVVLLLTSFVQSSSPDPIPVTVERTVTASPLVQISVLSLIPSQTSSPLGGDATTSITSSLTTSTTTPSSLVPPVQVNTSPPPIPPTTSPQIWKWSATPFTSVITVTGQAKTLTITPTAPPTSTALSGQSSGRGGLFSHTGKVVGLFVSVALVILLAAVLGIAFFIRRKRSSQAVTIISNTGDDTPQRRPSRLSQMGLVSGSQRLAAGKGIPNIQTSGWGPGTSDEKSPSDATTPWDLRSSYPRVVDQRLDPVALWNPLHDNGSHISVRSFQDDQDYSRRMLRIANPDK